MTMDTVASSSSVAIPKSVNMLGVANTLYANGPVTGTFTGSNMATAFAANWTGPATTNVLCYRDALTFAAGATGVVNQYTGYNFGGCPSSATANCTEVVALRVMGNLNGKGINTVIRAREQTSGTINAVLFLESNNPTCGSGIVAGTAADTCLYRGAAGVWTFNNGTSLRVPQYACVGCSTSAPANTGQGDFTSTNTYSSCISQVGTFNQAYIAAVSQCGDQFARRQFVGTRSTEDGTVSPDAQRSGVQRITALQWPTASTGYYTSQVSMIAYPSAAGASGAVVRAGLVLFNIYSEGSTPTTIGDIALNGGTFNLFGPLTVTSLSHYAPGIAGGSNFTGSIGTYRFIVPSLSGVASTVTNYEPYYAPNLPTNWNATNMRMHRCVSGGSATAVNTCFSSQERTGATNNAWGHMDCNTDNDGCSLMAGTAYDTKWSRCRAGAWCPGTGQDIYTDGGSICAGATCSSLSSSAVGVYQAGVQVIDTLTAGTGISITGSGNSRTISATGTAGVTSLAGTAGQISASASTGAITLSLPNPIQPAQSVPTLASLGAAAGTGGGASISNLVGTNNAFFFDLTTGSAPISAGGVIATFTWSASWNVALNANGPACTAHIVNAEGVFDPAGYMSTYGPKLYAIPTSGSVATSLDFKLATGASAVALPVATTVKMLIRCDMAR